MKNTRAQAGKYIAMLSLLLICNLTKLLAGNVLIYGAMMAHNENTIAASLGHTVTIVDTTQWKAMTTSQFASYDAIIIPEPGWDNYNTGNNDPLLQVLNNTKTVWSPAITGTRVYISYDPLLDGGPVGFARVQSGIDSAATNGGTGLYFATGLLFFFNLAPSPVVIDFLSMVDSIRVQGGTCLEATFTYYPSYFTKTDSCSDGNSLKIVSPPGFYLQNPGSYFYCSGNTFNLNFYNNRDTFLTGNIFTAELSDATGNFSSPTILGTLSGTTSGTIPVTIPNGLPSGSGYKIRITSSLPYEIADGGNRNILINTDQDWYLDADHDHYYTGNVITQCERPGFNYVTANLVYRGDDYDDNNSAIHVAPKNILIYGPKLRSYPPNEQTLAIAQGHTVTVVNDAQWAAMNTAQFAAYDAIVIPDDGCTHTSGNSDFTNLDATKAIWSPAIFGRRCYIATDPIADNTLLVSINAINYVSSGGRTGLLVNTSCSFTGFLSESPISFLSLLDSIRIRPNSISTTLDSVMLPTHPVMDGISKDSLYGEHSYFTYYPETLRNLFSVDTHAVVIATPLAPIVFSQNSLDYLCDGKTYNIQYDIFTTFNSGNIFTLQLSNATGSFSSPINIGSFSSTTNGTISFTIPNGTPSGSGYRIRIVSSSPVLIGEDNIRDLHINVNRNWYVDADQDHYYTGNLINQCDSPGVGYTTTGIVGGLDCNDNDATISPGRVEVNGNAIDENCNGLVNESNSISFDGGNDSIVVAYAPNISLNPIYNSSTQVFAVTISAWIKLDVGSLTQKIVSRINSYTLEVNSSNQLQYRSGAYDANNPARFGQIPIGEWTHVAVVVVNDQYTRQVTFYINGQIVGSSTNIYQSYLVASGSDLFIGPNFHGKIDELTIWGIARTQAEIQADMCVISIPNSDLIAHYSFNQGIVNGNNSGVTNLIDNSGKNNNGVLRNFALSGTNSNWSDSYTLYVDADNDGFGSTTLSNCGVANNTDCDDNDALVHDGNAIWYLDQDGDHYYTGSPVTACHSPGSNYTLTGIISGNDCDDTNPSIHDGNAIWYLDVDGDHYYTGSPVTACQSPGNNFTRTGIISGNDCDDNDPTVHNANTFWYLDADGDLYVDGASQIQSCHSPGANYISAGILNYYDCDDNDPLASHPNQSWVLDADGDHFYVDEIFQCSSPGPLYVKRIGAYYPNDCNDNDPLINPAAVEILGNGIDENCNTQIDEILPCYPNIVSYNYNFCISNVFIGSIHNATSCEQTHYGVYTNLSTRVTVGSTQSIHLASSGDLSKFSVYVDWNDNSILGDDPSELVIDNIYVQSVYYGGTDATIAVPSNAAFGNHIMRVISDVSYWNISDPCFSYYGEVEDYTLSVGNCIPVVDYVCQGDPYISNVTIGSFSNSTNCNGVTDYSSTLAVETTPGSTLICDIAFGGSFTEQGVSIYVDYNGDGDFNDVDEQVLNFAYAQPFISNATGTFTIPPTLPYGNYKIRVVSDNYYVGSSDPCHSYYGEIEDYTLSVVSTVYCQPIINSPCAYEWIANFTLGSINNSTACSSGYENYSFAMADTIQQGEPLNYSVTYGGYLASFVDIYIDLNSDGDFDDVDEQLVTDAYVDYSNPLSGPFSIPGTIAPGKYRIRVRIGNDNLLGACDNSNYGEIEDYSLVVTALNSCVPLVDIRCTNQSISQVYFGTINNPSGCSGGYANYATTLSTNILPNEYLNYTIQVNGFSAQQVNIFIDFNGDNDFDDADEHVVTNSYASQWYNSPSGYFYIPYTVAPGNYRVRIMTDTYSYSNPDVDPCHIGDGEVEDYMLNVLYPFWYRDFDGDNYGDPSVFVNAEVAPPGYVGNNTDCDDHNASAHPGSAEIAGNSIDDNCNGVVDELYCIPVGTSNHCNTWWINRVVIGSIDNSTGCTAIGYSDFSTTQSTIQTPNSIVTYNIYGYGNDQIVNIYIDFNSDFDFDDSGEEVATEVFMQNNGAPATGSFTVPSTLAAGNYRMRVISEYSGSNYLSSCVTYYGETEDYNLSVVTSCVSPTVPTISSTSISNCGVQNTTLSITSGDLNDATNWKWYSGSCGGTIAGTGTSITVSPATTTTYFARGEGGCVTNGSCASLTINVTTPQTWYQDIDGDGYGNNAVTITDCSTHAGYVTSGGDCEDGLFDVHPGATEICGNGIDDNCNGQADEGCALLVNLKVFIQGYYLGAGLMNAVIDPINSPLNCDTLVLQLANATSPYQIQFTDTAILHTNGSVQFEFPLSALGSHYLVLRHRNAIETWSATSQNLSSGFYYDFTDASNKSYGNNVAALGDGKFSLWSGDISDHSNLIIQDGNIDQSDFERMEIEVQQLIHGYLISDLTGDNMIESADYSLIENNIQLNIITRRP